MDELDAIRQRHSNWGEEPAEVAPAADDELAAIRERHSAWKAPRGLSKPAVKQEAEALTDDEFKGGTLELGFPPLTGTIDTGIPVGAGTRRRQAQLGSGFADVIQGAQQIAGSADTKDVDAKRAMDERLKSTLTGKALNFTGNVLPWLAVPNGALRGVAGPVLGPLIENTAIGAAQGAAAPVGTGESRALNAAASGAASGALSLAPAMARAHLAAQSPEKMALAEEAMRRGMPLSFADVSDSNAIKSFRSILDDSWIPGMSSRRQQAGKQDALNRMTGEAWGTPRSSHTPEELRADAGRIGGDVQTAWSNHDVPYQGGFGGLESNLARRRADAAEFGTGPGTVGNQVDVRIRRDLEDSLRPDPSGSPQRILPGENAFAIQKDWRGYEKSAGADSTNEAAKIMVNARRDVIDAYRQQLPPAERARFDELRSQYRALMTMNGVMDKNAVGRAGREIGDIRPTDLSSAVQHGYPGAGDRSPFGNTPRIGEQFMVDRVKQTGGSAKAAMQNIGGLSALGAAGFFGGAASLPALGGAVALGLGAGKAINSPSVLRGLMRSPYRAGAPAMERLLAAAPNRIAAQGALSGLNMFSDVPRAEVRGTRDSRDEDEGIN